MVQVRRVRYVRNPKTNRWIVVGGGVWETLTEFQKKKAKAGETKLDVPPGYHQKKPLPKKVPRVSSQGKKAAFARTKKMQVAKHQELKKTLSSLPASRKAKRENLERVMAKKGEGRGSRTRGWGAAAPQKGMERHALRAVCGERCFLNPPEGYPVCGALRTGQGCKVDCRGVTSAKVRAAQWKNPTVYRKAVALQKEKCGVPKRAAGKR